MIKKMYNTLSNKCETDTNTDEETITINKSKFTDDILDLIGAVFMLGVFVGVIIIKSIILISRFW